MLRLFYIVLLYKCAHVQSDYFDRYNGSIVEPKTLKDLKSKNLVEQCLIDVKPCAPHEGSRIDGTCNNYKRPTRGSAQGPYLRLLHPDYANKKHIRMNRNGKPLPSARKVRTMLQSTGRVVDRMHFNVAATSFAEFIDFDVSFINGSQDYLRNRTYCCERRGESDPRCIPIEVPEDDPYLRVTGVRCLNFSRAETFQDRGCIPDAKQPEQINLVTPVIDLSTVYGNDNISAARVRGGKEGLLKMEMKNDRYVPLNIVSQDVCFQNRDNETVCYLFGAPYIGNSNLRQATLTIFFMRHHNRLAWILQDLNPCWKDDRIFKVARQINVATAVNIYMYELMPMILGSKNMLDFSLISNRLEFLSPYDEHSVPLIYAEYEIARRFLHTFIDGRIKKFDEKYHYVHEFSISDTLFRMDLIEQDKNFEEINRGTFYQQAAKVDDILDPELSEKYFGELQRAHDLSAIDIQRGRDFGLRGYNSYRQICGLQPAKKFEDFYDVMEYEKVEALKKLYEDVEDVDLLAGIISEKLAEDALVGPTLFCIIAKQLHRLRFSDRFWFERGDQYHSFTHPQLREIRKTNMARFACDNAEGIKFIQPRAFLNVGQGNEPLPCSHIPGPDLTKWRDEQCIEYLKQRRNNKPHSYNNFFSYLDLGPPTKHV